MPSLRLKRTKNNRLDKIVKQLKSLANDEVQVGHFQEQGLHYSGFSYPELMAFHHTGGDPNNGSPVIPRKLLDILWARHRNLEKNPQIKAAFTRWRKRPLSEESNKKLLDEIGRVIAKLEKAMFGDPLALPTNGSNLSPLVDTGDLRDHTAYKTSRNPKARTV